MTPHHRSSVRAKLSASHVAGHMPSSAAAYQVACLPCPPRPRLTQQEVQHGVPASAPPWLAKLDCWLGILPMPMFLTQVPQMVKPHDCQLTAGRACIAQSCHSTRYKESLTGQLLDYSSGPESLLQVLTTSLSRPGHAQHKPAGALATHLATGPVSTPFLQSI